MTVALPGGMLQLPFDRYSAINATNFSKLKEMARSPLMYQYRLEHPKSSDAMTLGRAAHTATLEPKRFEERYALWDEHTESGAKRPRRGKDFEFFAECHKGKEIILADEWYGALEIAKAFRSDPRAMKYLAIGSPEVTMIWNEPSNGRQCKARVDWLTTIDGVHHLVGLKTARDIRMRQFGNACEAMGYHMQWAWYETGYKLITDVAPRVVELVVESNPPHDIAVYVIPDEVLELGRGHYKSLLEDLERCEKSGAWPGSMPGEQMLQLPEHMYGNDSDLGELDLDLGDDGDE